MGGYQLSLCWDGSSRVRVGCPNLLTPSFFFLCLFLSVTFHCLKILSSCFVFIPLHHLCSWTALFLFRSEVEGDADAPLSLVVFACEREAVFNLDLQPVLTARSCRHLS